MPAATIPMKTSRAWTSPSCGSRSRSGLAAYFQSRPATIRDDRGHSIGLTGSVTYSSQEAAAPAREGSVSLARTCKPFRNTRPRAASNDHDAGEPTPIFRGRLRWRLTGCMSTAPLGIVFGLGEVSETDRFRASALHSSDRALLEHCARSCHGCRAADWVGRIVDETVSWVGRRSPEQTGTAESVI